MAARKQTKAYTKVPRGATAPCWGLAIIDPNNEQNAICQVKHCVRPIIGRGGKNGSKFCTQNITLHMERSHSKEFGPLLQAFEEKKALKKQQALPSINTFLAYSRKNPCKESQPEGASNSASSTAELGMSQGTIENTMQSHWPINDPKSRTITYKILEMIVLDNRPYSMVRDIGFSRLMNHLRPKYTIPSRSHFVETVLPNVYKHIKAKVEEILSTAVACSLTTDGWRARNKDEFMSLTAHCIYPDFAQQALVLHTKPFNYSHTAENIVHMINSMIEDFSIPTYKIHHVLHDNASNMTSAFGTLSDYDSLPCFIHTTQLVVEKGVLEQPSVSNVRAKCKKIGAHLNHSSVEYHKLAEIQRAMSLPVLKFINDVATRWDSEYDSLVRVQEMRLELTNWMSQVKYL